MRCNEAVSFMQEDLDHHLSPVQREKLLLHIEQCSSCMELYWRLKLLEKDIAPLPQIKPPYSLVDRVLPKLPFPDSTGSRAAIVRPLQKSSKQLDRQFRFCKRRFRRYGLGIVATVFGFCMVSLGFTVSSLQTEGAVDAGEIFITAEQSETEPVQPPSEQNMLMEEKPSSQQKVEPVHVEPVKAEKKDDGPNVKGRSNRVPKKLFPSQTGKNHHPNLLRNRQSLKRTPYRIKLSLRPLRFSPNLTKTRSISKL